MSLFAFFLLLTLPIISNGLSLSHEKLQSTFQSYDNEFTDQVCGRDTTSGQVPFYVSIEFKGRNYKLFSGVLISNRWVLTAAYYTFIFSGFLQVVLGDEWNNKTIGVEKSYIHPDFNFRTGENNIALLELKEPVEFSRNIQPICLPEPGEDETFYGRNGTVAGFKIHPMATEVEGYNMQLATIIRSDVCRELYAKVGFNKSIITESLMCAGYSYDVLIPGFGPLMVNVEKNWVLVGISMNDIGCQDAASPRICHTSFLRVGLYLDWIKKTVH